MTNIKKIIISGFPHTGTSILKSIIGHIPDVYEHPIESKTFSKHIMEEAIKRKKKYVLIKCPLVNLSKKYYNNCIKIHIIRDPRFVFSSINKRFKYNIPKTHRIDIYEKYGKLYLDTLNVNTYYHMKYEDMFTKKFKNLKALLTKIGFKYDDTIFNNNKYKNVITQDDIDDIRHKPSHKYHSKYRTWQINQPIQNMNTPDKLDLLQPQMKKLKQSEIIIQLGYNF